MTQTNLHFPLHLPEPDAIAKAHSERLLSHIREQITSANGQINFSQFMDLALYTPGLGYYSAGAHKIGVGGDFVTAPEISPLFSRCIARQCLPILKTMSGADILELGAGSGSMAVDLLLELASCDQLPNHYFILEVSADLRQRQQANLQDRCPHLAGLVVWLDKLPAHFQGIIIANEVMDALPVHRFRVSENQIQELYVGWQNGKFFWKADEVSNPLLTQHIEQLLAAGLLSLNYESEVNLLLPAWIMSLSDCLQQGLILLIDYGFPRHEFYHPDRDRGTLMCHYQHRAHDDPLQLVGLQDITAHVDFTQVAEAASDAGLDVAGYTSQAAFLLGCDLEQLATMHVNNYQQQLLVAQQIKLLTMPSEMGELCKVMALTRQLDMPLSGFALQDRRGRL